MNWLLLLLLCQASVVVGNASENDSFDSCDNGNWIDQNVISSSKFHRYRFPSSRTSFEDGIETWLESACPFESILFSCYYKSKNNQFERAKTIENRQWIPNSNSNSCLKFWPIDMLHSVSNRVVYFAGDSTMRGLFQYLICSLYSIAANDYRIKWIREPNVICPSTAPLNQHCRLQDMMIYFPTVNTTFRYIGAGYEHQKVSRELVDLLFNHKVNVNDIVILNWGLHGGDETTYKQAVNIFVSTVENRMVSENRRIPTTLFLETIPQHFQTDNGYYKEKPNNKVPCAPLQANDDIQKQLDWRNRIINEAISRNYGPSINNSNTTTTTTSASINNNGMTVVSIAKSLYSQFDSHMGFRNVSGSAANGYYDCTHICFHSGVHDFILMKIFNTLVNLGAIKSPLITATTIDPKTNTTSTSTASTTTIFSNSFNGLLQPYSDNTLIRADSERTIYLVSGQSRHAFMSQRAFVSRGFDFSDVKVISDFDMENIPVGDPLH